jgi:thioredoxin-disulfide reductase
MRMPKIKKSHFSAIFLNQLLFFTNNMPKAKAVDKVYDVIIIGGGPAGLAAAIYVGRKRLSNLVVSIDIGGQCNLTAHIENYPGVLPQSGSQLMEVFHSQAQKFGAEFVFGKVSEIKKKGKEFEVIVAGDESYVGKTIIIAFGKVPRKLGIPGEDKFFGRGVSTCATCDGPLFKNKNVAVVGGGNAALEAALDLSNFAKKVYLIHRRDEFRGDEVTVEKVKKASKVELVLNSAPIEVKGEKFVSSIMIENVNDKKQRELEIDGMFLEIGYVVDSSMAKALVKINENNEIVTDKNGQTSCQGVFAAGDVTDTPFKQAIIAAGDGARAALGVYTYLTCDGMIGKKIAPDWHCPGKKEEKWEKV